MVICLMKYSSSSYPYIYWLRCLGYVKLFEYMNNDIHKIHANTL